MNRMSKTLISGVLPILVVKAAILMSASGQAHNNTMRSKNTDPPAPQQQEVPTFVGSDGVVRKVSPSAILAEMKRCLPSGLPIPVESLWPQLPPSLEPKGENPRSFEGEGNPLDFGTAKYQDDDEKRASLKFSLLKNDSENKRVLRSEESALKAELSGGHNGQFPPRDSVVYAATELDTKKLTDILKDLVTKQMQKNATSEAESSYLQAGGIQNRGDQGQKTIQTDDYPDYDYEEHRPNLRKPNYVASREERQFSRNPKRRRPNRRKQAKPNIQEYDYEESPEETGIDQKELKSWVRHQGGKMFGDAFQRQLELSDAVQSMTKELTGRTDLSPPQMPPNSARTVSKLATPHDEVVEGYKKVLATVMELNVNLVQTLERILANSICQKGIQSGMLPEMLPAQSGAMARVESQNPDATSVLLDCVDVLMQQRKTRRPSKTAHENVFRG